MIRSTLLLFGAIVLGLTSSINAANAQPPIEKNNLGLDLKLNSQQLRAIGAIGDFAISQMETMLTTGLDPKKIERVESQRQSENLRQTLSTLRLDDRQKQTLRTVLQTAREQMRRQIEAEK